MWIFVRCAHIEACLVVTGIAAALALSAGRGLGGAVSVAAAVLAGQLSIGWANDWLDAGRDAAAGRTDKPTVSGVVRPASLRFAAFAALAACVALSALSGPRAALVHLLAVGFGWMYDLRWKLTPASALAYVGGFGLLPVWIGLGAAGSPLPRWWVPATGALLGAGAHLANALPDLEDDRRTGVDGLPQRLGAAWSLAGASALLVLASLVAVLAPPGAPPPLQRVLLGVCLGAVALVVVVAGAGRRRAAFPLTMVAAVAVVGAFLAGGAALQ